MLTSAMLHLVTCVKLRASHYQSTSSLRLYELVTWTADPATAAKTCRKDSLQEIASISIME